MAPTRDGPTEATGGEDRLSGRWTSRVAAWQQVRGIALQLAYRAVAAAVGVVTVTITTRSLGPQRYGVIATAFALFSVLVALSDSGMSQIVVRDIAVDRGELPRSGAAYIVARLVLSVALMVVGGALSATVVFGWSSAAGVGMLVLSALPLTAASGYQVIAQGLERQEVAAGADTAQALFWLAGVVAVWRTGPTAAGYAAVFVGAAATLAVFSVVLGRRIAGARRLAWRGAPARARRLFVQALPLGVGAIFVTVYYRLDGLLVYQLTGPRAAGEYGASYRFLDVAVLAAGAVVAVITPLLARWAAEGLYGETERLFRHWLLVAGITGVVLSALSRPAALLLYGSDFVAAPRLAALLGWSISFIMVSLVGIALLTIHERYHRYPALVALAMVVNLAGNLLLLPRIGVDAAAWMTVATEAVVATGVTLTASRVPGLRAAGTLALRALMAVAVAASTMTELPTWWLRLVLGAAAFAVTSVVSGLWPPRAAGTRAGGGETR